MKTNKFLIFWLLCSFLNYGATFGYFQAQDPDNSKLEYCENMGASIGLSVFGPLSIASYIFVRILDYQDWKKIRSQRRTCRR